MPTATISTMPTEYYKALENYASLVERTNNQLGLGINLSSLAVAILSVLIAAIAIGVAYYLWKNSREQKELFANLLEATKKRLEEQWQVILEQKKSDFDKSIKDLEIIKETTAQDAKNAIQNKIDEIKKEKESLPVEPYLFSKSPYVSGASVLGSTSVMSAFDSILNSTQKMICTKCGKSFKYYDQRNSYLMSAAILSDKSVFCSHCGAKNAPQ